MAGLGLRALCPAPPPPSAALLAATSRPCAAAARPALPSRAARPTAVVADAAQTGSQQQQQRRGQQHPAQQRHRALNNPAKIAGSSQHSITVQDRGGELSLDAYCRLPTEQYNELDPSMIFALGGSTFLLKVPRVQLFDVYVEPEVVVDVSLSDGPNGVIFESGECRLKGSPLLQRLELDRKFVLYFHTMLTWEEGGTASSGGTAKSAANGSANGNGSSSNGNGIGNGKAGSSGGGGVGHLKAVADVQVWSEVVGPFALIPRSVLEATGNAVLGALMRALLPVFMRKLAEDYQRWSTSPEYRARRAASSAAAAGGQGAKQPMQAAQK